MSGRTRRAGHLLLVAAALAVAVLAVVPASPAAAATDTVTITVTSLDPVTVTPGAPIIVTGTVINVTDVTIRGLVIRLQRGSVLTSRDALADNDDDASPAVDGFAPFVDLADAVDAGDSVAFSYATTAEELGLSESGVYPLLVNVNGTPDGDVEQRVGELHTVLPFFATPPAAPTSVAWLWPLVDRPHRGADGLFLDDQLADSVAGGGRLERLLSLAEARPDARLTLAVDPLLLDDLQAMVVGYRTVTGVVGGGGAAAGAWLERLTALAARHSLLALPYADADVVSLTRAGLTAPADAAIERGRAVVADALGREPEPNLAWPIDGLLTEAALGTFDEAGETTYVLSPAAVDGTPRRTPSAVSTIRSSAGEVNALVSDSALDRIVAAADSWPTGPRLAVQRYLAELAMITAESPSVGKELLVVPPRRFDPRATYAPPMLAATESEAWLASTDVAGLDRTRPVARGTLIYPDAASRLELDAAGLSTLRSTVRAISDFESMLVVDTDEDQQTARRLTDPLQRMVFSGASSAWRADAAGLRRWAADADDAVQIQRRQVFLIVPSDGTYSLASARASLVFTVENQLPLPVQVRISVDASLVAGLSTGEVGAQVLAPVSRTLIEVPATVERPGEFRVTSAIFTPAGGTLGEPVRLTVRSTVYGGVALMITIAAGGLLVLLIGRRAFRRIRYGRPPETPPVMAPPVEVGQ
ncbi:MAG: hypothetical protein H0T66_18330 [Geodermatophilaceae bacterium]|nr:hypothetical protein [Geodermatophilaceae bacterium]